MGGSSILPVDKAAQLYKKSWAKYIAFCSVGGTFTNHKWKDGEAKAYHKRLIKLGVPRKSILWEGLTTNTLDEVKTSVKFIKKKGVDIKTMILVDRPVHQLRAFATFTRWYPKIKYINIPSDEQFSVSKKLAMRLNIELERIIGYGKKGDIIKQKIPNEVKLAKRILEHYKN